MRNIYLGGTVLALFCLSFATSAQKNVDIAFLSEHFPPYQMQDEQGNVHGFATEIIKAAIAETDYTYSIKIQPWTRSYHMAQEDRNTCIYLIAKQPHRVALFKWVEPIITTTDYFIGLKSNSKLKIESIEDAKQYKVAVLKDDRTHNMLLNAGFVEQENLYVINNTYSLLKLLVSRKEIDLILADTINVVYRAKYNNIDPTMFKTYLKVTPEPIKLYLACSLATDDKIVESLSKAIKKIKFNGKLDAINRRWDLAFSDELYLESDQ